VSRLPDRFFLTGTDTDVGKTVTAAALCAAHGLTYWKPVQSGLADGTDTDTVRRLVPGVRTLPEAWRLTNPASPHTAARDDGVAIDVGALTLPQADRLLVEGAGGWMVPLRIAPWTWQSAIPQHLELPVVVVARTGLGTLNHTFSMLRAIRADGCEVAGLVLVGDPHPDNEHDLHTHGAPVLGRLPRVASLASDFGALVEAARAI